MDLPVMQPVTTYISILYSVGMTVWALLHSHGNTYHVQHRAANSTMTCGMGITPKTGIGARKVLSFHTFRHMR